MPCSGRPFTFLCWLQKESLMMNWLISSAELGLTSFLLLLCAMKTERDSNWDSEINMQFHKHFHTLNTFFPPQPTISQGYSRVFLGFFLRKAYKCFSSNRLSWLNTFFCRPRDGKCRDFSKSHSFRLKRFCSQLSAAVAHRTQNCCLWDCINNFRLQQIVSLIIWYLKIHNA